MLVGTKFYRQPLLKGSDCVLGARIQSLFRIQSELVEGAFRSNSEPIMNPLVLLQISLIIHLEFIQKSFRMQSETLRAQAELVQSSCVLMQGPCRLHRELTQDLYRIDAISCAGIIHNSVRADAVCIQKQSDIIQNSCRTHSELMHHKAPFITHSQFTQNFFRRCSEVTQNSFRTQAESLRNFIRTHPEIIQNLFRTPSEFLQNSCRTHTESVLLTNSVRPPSLSISAQFWSATGSSRNPSEFILNRCRLQGVLVGRLSTAATRRAN